MIDSRLAKLMQFVLGCGLILGAEFFLKTQSGTLSSMMPTVRPDRALKNYQRRMEATEQLLGGNAQLDNIYGRRIKIAQKAHRSKSS